mgnify:CR=1 FL=1
MIKLVCNNQLLYKTISNYLLQKNILLSPTNNNYQIVINIEDNEKDINVDINGYKTGISLPIDINYLNSEILKKIIDINFPLGDYKYFPYKRVICYQNKKSLLSDIQNLIISNLVNYQDGIDKDYLYNLIWKRDKSIYINKLDTHLTNLKKKLNQELNLKVNFQSHNKKLQLLIN